ncbi:MAG TPA: rhodanese-like domain-containing protein, partial [Mariniflexile sp.]|nr:rhodanese-like domain-containing protein [Mariniflexile sp.]
NVQLVDVRTPEEYNEAHIENAINIDVNGNNFTNEIAKLDKSKPVYIYCRSGGRSANAANIMQQEGFKTVNDLDGGFLNWQSKGYQSSK